MHFMSSARCIQGVLAGLPFGIPGMGDDIEGAMQQAPHFGLHFIVVVWHIGMTVVGLIVTFWSKSKSKLKTWVPV